jgi:hypothetical protein
LNAAVLFEEALKVAAGQKGSVALAGEKYGITENDPCNRRFSGI